MKIFKSGFLTNVLNPNPVIFIMAFIPQFISEESGSILLQSLILGAWLVILAITIFTLLGLFASTLAKWLSNKPRTILGLNVGAGATFIAAGISIANLEK